MKEFVPDISLSPRAERPFPVNEILWGSEEGGQACFPTSNAARERRYSNEPVPLEKFGNAVSDAEERIWIVDEYLLVPDRGKPTRRIEQILAWLPVWLAASDIRLLTKHHEEVGKDDLKKFQQRAEAINNRAARRHKECRIEVKTHLTKNVILSMIVSP